MMKKDYQNHLFGVAIDEKHHLWRVPALWALAQELPEVEVELSEIGHLLDYTLFLVDGRPYKSDPHGLLHVLDVLGVAKNEAVYVGDGSHDLECARRAGVAGGAALWGSLNREDLLDGHPDHSWESMDQVLLSLE